jgi:mono/diheme cytochrome c family protein
MTMSRLGLGLLPQLLAQSLAAALAISAAPLLHAAVDGNEVLERGETVYRASCATGYCHGINGDMAGAPRLAARGFDVAHIRNTISEGVAGTTMAGFATALSPDDLLAVMTYVAALNDIRNPVFRSSGGLGVAAASQRPALSDKGERGRTLFSHADKGVGRCSTCHELEGIGIPVAGPMADIPQSLPVLRALQAPQVQQISVGNESMPGLMVANGVTGVLFYDLTVAPPVLRSLPAGTVVQLAESNWSHANFTQTYGKDELQVILVYLNEIIRQ